MYRRGSFSSWTEEILPLYKRDIFLSLIGETLPQPGWVRLLLILDEGSLSHDGRAPFLILDIGGGGGQVMGGSFSLWTSGGGRILFLTLDIMDSSEGSLSPWVQGVSLSFCAWMAPSHPGHGEDAVHLACVWFLIITNRGSSCSSWSRDLFLGT